MIWSAMSEQAQAGEAEQPIRELYRVTAVLAVDATPAPPEITERFDGRLFTLHQLEERGVRIAGRAAWLLAAGRDWQLQLEPAV
jgi:hypothetical protein